KLLRAKIILFHRDETKYQVALNDMKEIITSGRYQLNPDYQNLWVKDGEWCAESIFEVCYAGNNSGDGFGLARSLGGRNIVDPRSAEQCGLGECYGQNTMSSTVYNMFKEGDTRRREQSLSMRTRQRKWQKWWPKVNCRQEELSK